MSEKVIIDGVNVAECEFVERFCTLTLRPQAVCKIYRHCTDNSECYYKQLQRVRAELQELNKKYTEVLSLAKKNADSNEYCLQELEKENEKLKAENKMLIEDLKSYQNWYDEQAQSNNELQKIYQSEHIDNLNYKQALEEIREIAKEPCIKGEDCSKCEINCLFKDIVDKISEVENG